MDAHNPKVALVHDWLNGMRGGEKCLEVLCEIFPEAHLYTLFHQKGKLSPTIEAMDIRSSWLRRLPLVRRKYRYYLPLMPRAIESLDLRKYDLVISLSHCVAKGVCPREGAVHLCYCFTPMRYVWDMYEQYFGEGRGGIASKVMPFFAKKLRRWDVTASDRVSRFIAISDHVRKRISRCYSRDADLIYPPVDCEKFQPSGDAGDYYLIVSAFAPYKRVDIAVEAFRRSGRRLKIVGSGQNEAELRALSADNVEFLGWRSDEEIAKLYSGCRAFIFPGEEDFGITPLEAQACGRPVIAYRKGGALETVVAPDDFDGRKPTGLFFEEQSPEALNAAIEEFEREDIFDPQAARENALRFDRSVFKEQMRNYIYNYLQTHKDKIS